MAKVKTPEEWLNGIVKKQHMEMECVLCGEVMKYNNFYLSGSKNAIARTDATGKVRMIACKSCAQKLFEFFLNMYKKTDKALFQFCAALDVYYDPDIIKNMTVSDMPSFVSIYCDKISKGKSIIYGFGDSPALFAPQENTSGDSTNDGLSEEDIKNRMDILSNFHYDPFENESLSERKKLYRNLCTMSDPAMVNDLVKQRAAIEIVRTFARIDRWTDAINELSADPQTMLQNNRDIKTLIDAKAKETDMITKFSKDHGFAERYATAKSKGAGTISATIRDMEEFDYDDGKVNFFDIKTSESMSQAAEISAGAIFKQLSLSEADYVDMLKRQKQIVEDLYKENDRLKEENRMIYKQITKQELLKELAQELKEKGMGKDEIAGLVMSEIKLTKDNFKK